MRILVTAVAIASALITVLVAIDVLMFLFRLHGPFSATGEALVFLGSFGRRKPRFTKKLWRSPLTLDASELRSLLRRSGLGAVFWLSVLFAAVYVLGPIPPVHEW